MIIKILNDKLQDKHLIEAAYLRWDYANVADHGYAVLEVHAVSTKILAAASISESNTVIEEKPSLQLRINHGDRVFIMNDDGKTIDSKRVLLYNEETDENE